MKVYSAPAEIPTPVFDFRDFDLEALQKAESEYLERLKAHLVELGYNGSNTGEEFHIPWADGHARYMVAERGHSMALVHLPLGDGWDVPRYMTRGVLKADVVQQIKRGAAFASRLARASVVA